MAKLTKQNFPAEPGKNATESQLKKYATKCGKVARHNAKVADQESKLDKLRKEANALKTAKAKGGAKKKR